MTLFRQAINGTNTDRPPVWMMRQAGRYHAHYRTLRQKHSFLDLCRIPDLACEVTMGPIEEFDFDAAILFSDILFPLNVLGTPLDFAPGPQLGFLLERSDDLKRYTTSPETAQLDFQAQALRQIRAVLPRDKGLIGFVGGMLTLYVFAVHGTHKTDLTSARAGFHDGRFDGFMDRILPVMLDNMVLQAREEIDTLAIFESCAGEVDFATYRDRYFPFLKELLRQFRIRCPDTPITYYGKGIGAAHWELLRDLPIRVLGVDYHQDMLKVLEDWTAHFSVQGNFDPINLTLDPEESEKRMRAYFSRLYALPRDILAKWVNGTGHGLTPAVREENVKTFIRLSRDLWEG